MESDINRRLAQGFTLPANWYTDPFFFKLEQDRIFRKTWNYAGRLDQVQRPGDYFTAKIGSTPIVILRDETEKLRGYVNVCRHRGAEILPGRCSGNRKTLQCHYHAWTWDLDGQLKSAPRSNQETSFQKDHFPLIEIRVETLGPLIFACLDANAPNWKETLGTLPRDLIENQTPLQGLRLRGTSSFEVEANWKIIVENYLECYHCPIAHKSFSKVIDLTEYGITFQKWGSIQQGAAHPSTSFPSNQSKNGLYAYVWPAFMLNTYPGPALLSMNMVFPIHERRTLLLFELFMDDEISEKEAQEKITFINEVQAEDTVLCESVQRGMDADPAFQGRLILNQEKGIQHFQNLIYEALSKKDRLDSKTLPA
ncbi:MAG: aromatic ring-hydroxylating dioxygenase subunit alpha [Bdellovibrio sp.]|nr:aromatic ring-hydroxylating dioxygenase subunit alpha [Bdellovibrio sp.]